MWPGNAKPAAFSAFFWIGLVTSAAAAPLAHELDAVADRRDHGCRIGGADCPGSPATDGAPARHGSASEKTSPQLCRVSLHSADVAPERVGAALEQRVRRRRR